MKLPSHVKDDPIHGISCVCDMPARNLMLKTFLKGFDCGTLQMGLSCRLFSILQNNTVFEQLGCFLSSVEHMGRFVHN
jgi:hypothetical protein